MAWFKYLLIPICLSSLCLGCTDHSSFEKARKSLIEEKRQKKLPTVKSILLGFSFDDSPTTFQNKIDSLLLRGNLISPFPKEFESYAKEFNIPIENFYYIFIDVQGLENDYWSVKPSFKHDRLIGLVLTTNVIVNTLINKELNDVEAPISTRRFLESLIEASQAIIEDMELSFRLVKTRFSNVHGPPDIALPNRSYWIISNKEIDIKHLPATKIDIKFSNLSFND
ncbi:MAG: hypothetical protein O6939_07275 [Bacteroidetes bacterium]|nr:hypothetical protein [Bacteroidota bacterium]